MPRYVTIGYGDREGYDRTAPSVRNAAHDHEARLRADGALIGIAGRPIQVRNHERAGIHTTDGAFLHADRPIAGFAIIEASDLDDAVRLVADTPCAVAYGVVAVGPLDGPSA